MKSKQCLTGVLLAFILLFVVAGTPLGPRPAQASYEDAAIFYDELSPHGSWVDYDKYGPVWYPNKVEEDWRPYTNGRWTPSEQGYMFETDEPWAWATYHYGNWMPTEDYGWVWAPGRTWYPNTVAWRNSPEDAPVDTSYIGWAPIPPPNYTPPPAYASPGYGGGYPGYGGSGGYPGYDGGLLSGLGGLGPGGSALNLLTAPFWVFSQASRFLLGFGQPYSPAYSYSGCGCLAPPNYYQTIYPTTSIVRSWYYPNYYQPALLGSGMGLGAYSWGPPVRYVSRVTHVNYITINNYMRHAHVHRIHGGWPDEMVFRRNRYLRHIVPVENPERLARFRPMQVRNMDEAVRHLGNPRAIVQPADLRPLDRTSIPKARPAAFTGERPAKVRGMELPRRAQQQITPQMDERLKKFRSEAAQGPAGADRRQRGRGQWVRPEDSQRDALRGPKGAQRMGRGQPEAIEGQRGLRRGPGEGPETSRGMRRGPVEGFQGPEAGGVRRGPGEGPETSKGLRRGPGEGPQGPAQAGRGRPEGFQTKQQRQLQQQQIMRQQQQERRLEKQEQWRQRREQMQRQQVPERQLRQQQEQLRRQQMQQQQQQRRQQLERQPGQQFQQQQLRRQQEQQRRQQFRQQQEQSRRQQMRQFQGHQHAQQVQRQKRERPQQHSRFQMDNRSFQDR